MVKAGFFGKITTANDFIYHGLPLKVSEAWAECMAGWIAASRAAAGTGWEERYFGSPVWRFGLAPKVISPNGWIGMFASSIDGVGRPFPFTVMIEANLDLSQSQPVLSLDPLFDVLEERMLCFIEGQITREDISGVIAETAVSVPAALLASDIDPVVLPGTLDAAVCLRGILEEPAIDIVPDAFFRPSTGGAGDRGLCCWWHEGAGARRSEVCVTRGIPAAAAAIPIFLGNWENHGWQKAPVSDYLVFE